MRIDKIEIDGFGKLNNCSYTFSDGVNLIYGKNESGKSTICEFILAMFYGLPNKSKQSGDDMAARIKYCPWNADSFGGRLYFTDDNGKKLVVERIFKSTKRGDRTVLRNADNWEEISTADNLGEKYFGISREGFLKTLYVKSFGADTLKSDDGEIMSRLSNLETSADEDVSYSKIINDLEKEIFSLKTKTSRGGKITDLEGKITDLNTELTLSSMTHNALKTEKEEAENLKSAAIHKEKEAKILEEKYEIALSHEKFLSQQKIEETQKVIEERLKIQKERLKDLVLQLENADEGKKQIAKEEIQKAREYETKKILLTEKIETLKEETKAKYDILPILLIILGVILCVAGVFHIIIAVFGALSVVFGILLKLNIRKTCLKSATRVEALYKDIAAIDNALEEIYAPYGVTISDELSALFISENDKTERQNQLKKQYEECTEEIKNLENSIIKTKEKEEFSKEVTEYAGESAQELFQSINTIKEQIIKMRDDANKISVRIAKETAEIRTEEEIKTELDTLKEEKQEFEKRHASLVRAAEWLNSAHAEIKNNFAPRLNEKASELLSYLTSEKYEDMRTNDSFSINLKSAGGEIVKAEFMSRGTYDLLYIALRFASMSVLTNGHIPPVVLDDAFSQLDDQRLKQVAKLIEEDKEFSQVFLFTCHENYKEVLKNTNLIELQ